MTKQDRRKHYLVNDRAEWRTFSDGRGSIHSVDPAGVRSLVTSPFCATLPSMKFDPTDWFERRSDIGGGALLVKGTRVPVRTLLASLAEGAPESEILADFPTVPAEALRAVIAFAAAAAADDLPPRPIPVAA